MNDTMRESIGEMAERVEEIVQLLSEPGTAGDPVRYGKLRREHDRLFEITSLYGQYEAALEKIREAREILSESDDQAFRGLALEEIRSGEKALAETDEALRRLMLPRDPRDEKNVIIEIRSGAGGEEAALFCAVLFRMYSMYAEGNRWRTEILGANETELGGYKNISFSITGDRVYSKLKYESGVHRVQRVPETETQGRIHTSTVTVAVLPEADEVDVVIAPGDLQIDSFRSSGAGGQHINKTSSAIRITHLPTGMVVECQDERSQLKNKEKAMKVLRSRLLAREQERSDAQLAAQRRQQVGSGDRSERIRTYNYPQNRVTDHRINVSLHRLEAILNGDLEDLISALVSANYMETQEEQES